MFTSTLILLLACLSSRGPTASEVGVAETTDQTTEVMYISDEGDLDHDLKQITREGLPVELQDFIQDLEKLESLKETRNLIFSDLSDIFNRMSILKVSNDLDPNSASMIMQSTCALVSSLQWGFGGVNERQILSSGATVVVSNAGAYANQDPTNIYEDRIDNFAVNVELIPKEDNIFPAFVIYQKNTSPLRPLPLTETPITWFRAVDVLIGYQKWDPLMDTVRTVRPSLSMVWKYATPPGNTKYACASWNETNASWSTLSCTLINVPLVEENDDLFRVVCYCEVSFNGNVSQHVMYQYEREIRATVKSENGELNAAQEYSQYRVLINDLTKNLLASDLFSKFLSRYLNNVMVFDNNVLTNSSADKVLEDIGTILGAVTPEGGRHTIGLRNELLASFVVESSHANQRDLPIGFGVYNDLKSGIESFMATEDIDPNILFSSQMNFSLLFSKSVVQQNARYAFLLYPPGKFFKAAMIIDGKQVVSMRVVDIMMTPNDQDCEDQFVHMYHGMPTKEYEYGCAHWNTSLGNWTQAGCYNNPALYLGVCTCKVSANFNETRSRGQYIVYKWFLSKHLALTVETQKTVRNLDADTELLTAILQVNVLQYFFRSHMCFMNTMLALSKIVWRYSHDGYCYYRMKDSVKTALLEVVRKAGITSDECTNFVEPFDITQVGALCVINDDPDSSPTLTYRAKIRILLIFGGSTSSYTLERYNFDNDTIWILDSEIPYVLRLSASVMILNEKHVFFLYPVNAFIRPPPTKGKFFNSRVVDVVLKPRSHSKEVKQYVEFTFNKPARHLFGCGVWDELSNDWTTSGCQIVSIASTEVCNCSLAADGGQYIVYSYTDAVLDEHVLTEFAGETFMDPASIYEQGSELIHNASLLTVDTRLVNVVLLALKKMLFHTDEIADRQQKMQLVLEDIEIAFRHMYGPENELVQDRFDSLGNWTMKRAELVDDLFSNAVLSSSGNSDVSTTSEMALVVLGGQRVGKVGCLATEYFFGVQYSREGDTNVEFVRSNLAATVLSSSPAFACFINDRHSLEYNRAFFLVYPMNTSPNQYKMTSAAVFNSRQVDIFISWSSDTYNNKEVAVEVYFHPTAISKDYVHTTCAVWNETDGEWVKDFCSFKYVTDHISCTCGISSSSLWRIIIYEYTEQPNFTFTGVLGLTSAVYLVGSSMSLIGLVMIATTAILFPEWRAELGTKILLHLASSNFLYLTLTMYRETHTIYADMKHLDMALVAFTVSVHYTRLVHHCWGLVMSVLQYKRFSGVVGASATTPHLLLKISVLAWGVPILPLAVLLSWDVRAHFCTPNKLTHYMLYLVPVVVITLLNIGLLVAIVRVITNGCGLWDDDQLQRHGGSNREVIMRQLKQTVMMFFLFGIPAVFELFNDLVFHSTVMVYINKALDPIQGYVLFLFFILFNDKARGYWIVRVFGDVPAVVQATNVKIPHFKPKHLKKSVEPRPVKRLIVLAETLKAEVPIPEVEIVMDAASEVGFAVKYVVQKNGENDSEGVVKQLDEEDVTDHDLGTEVE